ncbi:hypothetical protein Agabi119p4_10615 [Agaricus bisporus var. burnettii]|uniref:Uncharacterized protein n=1 Tax=Agaricus bisporus var. burnettii TaxID=192524 RepID=A0A8H7C2J8_AGABI|nr:hypothetical protein Agabi119p4_10615 [Agaricus bisporus var. burnettii]
MYYVNLIYEVVTVHGALRRGIRLTPPAGSNIQASSFTPEIINNLNRAIGKDLCGDLCLTVAHAAPQGVILVESTCVPTSQETAFMLKHVRRLFPVPQGSAPIADAPATSTTYLKVLDVPIISDPDPKSWVNSTRAAFKKACSIFLVGMMLTRILKHKIRIMRNSQRSDSCTAWVDIQDTTSGARGHELIGNFISFAGVNCRIAGAKPHAGSVLCTRCMRWGHHSSQCRALRARCALCGGPHSEANHWSYVAPAQVEHRQCVNCTAAKREKRNHSATDRRSCSFWKNRYDREWLQRQFKVST